MVKAATWLSITPEPERDLPRAVATLACGAAPPAAAVAAETERVEGLILRGSERAWLAYLHAVVKLIDRRARDPDGDVQRARACATAVISNHHNLLLGLRGRGA
ncbi:MAG: hypothetical protein JO240_09220, partial [Solirubrobacterales bacterium]|nr:hypothetical protein [Solirubrobacterales bacterium]